MPATDFSPLRFSTCGLLERELLSTWREQFGRGLLRVDIEPLEVPFYAGAELWALPEVRVVQGIWSAAHFRRTRALVADGDDSIGIIVSKGTTALQRDRDVALGAGDGVALLSQEPADVAFSEGPILIVSVPRATLEMREQYR